MNEINIIFFAIYILNITYNFWKSAFISYCQFHISCLILPLIVQFSDLIVGVYICWLCAVSVMSAPIHLLSPGQEWHNSHHMITLQRFHICQHPTHLSSTVHQPDPKQQLVILNSCVCQLSLVNTGQSVFIYYTKADDFKVKCRVASFVASVKHDEAWWWLDICRGSQEACQTPGYLVNWSYLFTPLSRFYLCLRCALCLWRLPFSLCGKMKISSEYFVNIYWINN